MEKYNEKFTVPDDVNYRKLSSWKKIAWKQIERWLDDDEFREYVSKEVLKNADNPPGPFTRFLYWFGFSCEAGWGTMVDFNERSQQSHLVDKYYKWMHQLRDEIIEYRAGGVVLNSKTSLQDATKN